MEDQQKLSLNSPKAQGKLRGKLGESLRDPISVIRAPYPALVRWPIRRGSKRISLSSNRKPRRHGAPPTQAEIAEVAK